MNLLQRYGDFGLIPRNVKGIEHCNAKRLMKKVGLVMRSTFDIYSPMQDVAPKAVKNMSN